MVMESTKPKEQILLQELDTHCARYLELRAQLRTPGLSKNLKEHLEGELAGVISLLESSAEQYADL
jgi:hypothetical protein